MSRTIVVPASTKFDLSKCLTFQRWETSDCKHQPAKEHEMLAYRVEDMTCGHCASTITKAVQAVDARAKVQVDLARQLVSVEPTEADAQELSDAITQAGYTPVPVELREALPAQPRTGGCCCGSGVSRCGS